MPVIDLNQVTNTELTEVDLGNVDTTTESIQVWANGTTGDDSNDGLSESTPKKTIPAAADLIPPVLQHSCTINLRGTFTLSGFSFVRIQKSLLGSILVIDGGPDTEVLAGPFTADAATSSSISDSGQTWTIDEHVGKHVEILTGPAAGETRTIYENSATTLTPSHAWSTSPGIGATFQISQPATKILSPSGFNALVVSCTPLNTFQNYPAIQRITLDGKIQLYHVGGAVVLSGVVNRSTLGFSPGLRSESPGVFFPSSFYTNPTTYAFQFIERVVPTSIGVGGGVQLLQQDGVFINGGFILNDASATFNRTTIAGSADGLFSSRVVDGHITIRNSVGQDALRVSGSSSVGININSSNLDTTGLRVDSCSSHAVEVSNSQLTHSLGAVTGAGSAGAGMYVHSQGIVHTKSGSPPTIAGGVPGEVSLDGTTQKSTWAAIEAGTPINGATAGNDEFVIVKKV